MKRYIVILFSLILTSQNSYSSCVENFRKILEITDNQSRESLNKEKKRTRIVTIGFAFATAGVASGIVLGMGSAGIESMRLSEFYNADSLAIRANAFQMLSLLQSSEEVGYNNQIQLVTESLRRFNGLEFLDYETTYAAIQSLNQNEVLCPNSDAAIGIVTFGNFFDLLKKQLQGLSDAQFPRAGITNTSEIH